MGVQNRAQLFLLNMTRAPPTPSTRRRMLAMAGGGLAAAALSGLPGCALFPVAAPVAPITPFRRPYSALPLARPIIHASEIVRVAVGLRPYRRSGFVVRGEKFGDKRIIHNYGHGGGGLTLSWGSSTLAVAECADITNITDRRATVLGCGVMGLTTARLLQANGWRVQIVARELPPHTTSDVAGGMWAPTGVFERDTAGLTPAFEAQFKQALHISQQIFSALIGRGYGVSLRENYHLSQTPLSADDIFYLRDFPQLFPNISAFQPGGHPFPSAYALHHLSMLIEPSIFLPRLMDDIRQAGGSITQHELRDQAEILALDTPVIFNCTGLGAKALFGDDELTPIRGQVVVMPADARIDYLTHGGTKGRQGGLLYMFPRADGILLGGSYERGASHFAPDDDTTERIVGQHAALFGGMKI